MREKIVKQKKGFSILELLVVFFIILILSAIAIPQFSNNSYTNLRTSAYNIANRINEAKFRSINQITPHQLVIDTSLGTFSENRKSGSSWTTLLTDSLRQGVSFVDGSSTNPFPSGASAADGAKQCGAISGTCSPTLTTTISFNTNGLAVDNNGIPKANNSIYISDGKQYFAITVSLAGGVEVWYYDANANTWLRP